jgi:hypothetical protein
MQNAASTVASLVEQLKARDAELDLYEREFAEVDELRRQVALGLLNGMRESE